MIDFWLVVGRIRGRGFCQFYEYAQNARREYFMLTRDPANKDFMLVRYDGTSFEILERKK